MYKAALRTRAVKEYMDMTELHSSLTSAQKQFLIASAYSSKLMRRIEEPGFFSQGRNISRLKTDILWATINEAVAFVFMVPQSKL
jgi:hypothetical protein